MRFVLFYHSLISDWNHGNAHFLRGCATELMARGHEVTVYEPAGGWSLRNLLQEEGEAAVAAFHAAYPQLRSKFYEPATLDLDDALAAADVVLVHEWNDPSLIARIGLHRAAGAPYRLLFHDTHHRAVSDPDALQGFDLRHYDGVLVFGEVLRQIYLDRGWARRVWTWHEAADTRVFQPKRAPAEPIDLVWVGNWGDGERTAELMEFLIEPARALHCKARVHGVRYPLAALRTLREAGIEYGGWVANFHVPRVLAAARCTVHVPRRFYRESLPGIPTIRVFEALACGVPLVSAFWDDCEELFRPDRDFLCVRNGAQMREALRALTHEPRMARDLAANGLATIRRRHTCAHRVDELLAICRCLGAVRAPVPLEASV